MSLKFLLTPDYDTETGTNNEPVSAGKSLSRFLTTSKQSAVKIVIG